MTFSWELDSLDALQCVVKRDLKCSGIRISKKKDTHRHQQAQDVQPSSLFGKALQSYELIRDEESRCHVPKFLLECTKFLESHLDLEGIFRISGSKSRQRELKSNLENRCTIPEDTNPADVCSLFKQFFHTLPEPLIPPKLQSAFYKCSQLEDIAEQRWVVLEICHLLPPTNIQTLRFIALFLQHVALQAEKNRMDVSNLAKVFTPNFFGTFTALDKKNPERMIGLQTGMVRLLIENARLIGEVPDWMMEKILGQSRENLDRLTSEDELDKSDDNLEDSSRLSRRRRRKSGGSFQVLVSGLGHSLGILKTSSAENILSSDTHATESPKIMKRKASEDIGSAVTSTKRKALLHKMTVDPQFSKPGLHLHRTHYGTPSQRGHQALGETDAVTADGETLFRYGTPSIVYADDSFAGHTPHRLDGSEMVPKAQHDRWQGTPKSKLKRFKELSAKKLKRRSLAMNMEGEPFSTKSTKPIKTQGSKKKENNDVGWRLANASPPEGGLDTMKLFEQPVRPSPKFDTPSRPRRHFKTPSSPARLLIGASPDLRRSTRLHTSDTEGDSSDAMKPSRSSGDSPRVVVVDTHEMERASPKVVVVDTCMVSEPNLTEEYVKNQQEHASQLIGSKLGKERTSPSIRISDTTREKIKAAEKVYALRTSTEEEHLKKPVNQSLRPRSRSEDHVPCQLMPSSVSEMSLSSVLSGISGCSHVSEFSHFGSEAPEKQPTTTYMETDICSPCVYECKDDTIVPNGDSSGHSTDSTDETIETESESFPDTVVAAGVAPVDEALLDATEMTKNDERPMIADSRSTKVTVIVEGHSYAGFKSNGKETMSKSESIDSGKGCSMEDLLVAVPDGKPGRQVMMKQDSVDAGVVDDGSEGEMQGEADLNLAKDIMYRPEYESEDQCDDDDNQKTIESKNTDQNLSGDKGEVERVKTSSSSDEYDDAKGNVIEMSSLDGKKKEDEKSEVAQAKSITQKERDDEIFKKPHSVCITKNEDELQNLINAALKSDMKNPLTNHSQTLPVQDETRGRIHRKNSSIVKANIELFNSFTASDRNIYSSMRKTRASSQKEGRSGTNPPTPLTKSTSMDSGISNLQASGHPMATRSKVMNDSFRQAVGSRATLKILSASMENVSTPKEEPANSSFKESRTIQSSQSMLDISTPTTTRPLGKRAVRNQSTPNNKENRSSPASIRRRRPVSQGQKTAFQESDSFAKLYNRDKAFELEEEEPSVHLVKPLRDNNSPTLHRTRKQAPLDPRLATPLTPVHLSQHVRLRTPGSRKAIHIKHRSPVKPVKRLVKSPSPARPKGRPTPERENKTPKRYPRSPRNPLETASPQVRRQRSVLPVHLQDETWEL